MFKDTWALNAWNIEKQKSISNYFLQFLSFLINDPPRYLQQGGRKMWSKHPKKWKSWRNHKKIKIWTKPKHVEFFFIFFFIDFEMKTKAAFWPLHRRGRRGGYQTSTSWSEPQWMFKRVRHMSYSRALDEKNGKN